MPPQEDLVNPGESGWEGAADVLSFRGQIRGRNAVPSPRRTVSGSATWFSARFTFSQPQAGWTRKEICPRAHVQT